MATGVYYSDACLKHDTAGHPESRQRLEAIMGRLRACSDLGAVSFVEPRPASLELVRLVHAPAHVEQLLRVVEMGGGWLDPDTVASSGSVDAALHAVGGAVEAVEAVLTGRLENAFVAVRPPGHHATATAAMGFCLFNNVAIAARHSIGKGLAKRIAVVDFDVHHGNGTQDIFYEDPSVLYFSIHQLPLYPGSGSYGEVGEGPGRGYTVNVPMPPGVGDEGYCYALEAVLAPLARRYQPDLILVSAGYDGHWQDLLAGMRLTVPGFHGIATRLRELAAELCGGRMVCVLEGGYNLEVLAGAVEATVRVMSGSGREVVDPYGGPASALGRGAVESVVAAVRKAHGI